MGYRVAVVGATGNVGREMLNILAERAFPADEVIALASRRSQGTEVITNNLLDLFGALILWTVVRERDRESADESSGLVTLRGSQETVA